MNPRKKKLFWIAPLAVLGMALFIFVGGEVVMRLWNWLVQMLFGLRQITFWQAIGILALCRILFGSHGFRGTRSNMRRRMQQRMDERWKRMTPEERERLRQSWRGRCGFDPSTGESQGQ